MLEKMDTSFKENIKYKPILAQKKPGNQRHYEKTKSNNNRNRGRRINQGKRHRKYYNQNNEKKIFLI